MILNADLPCRAGSKQFGCRKISKSVKWHKPQMYL